MNPEREDKNPAAFSERRAWLPIFLLGLAVFIFVTTELLPVGLLPDIANGLGKTEAFTGLLLTIYAWTVTVLSLPMTVLTARFERRSLLLVLLGIFAASHGAAALSSSFSMLVAARLGVAMAHSVFWAIVTPLAVRIAPRGLEHRALGVVSGAVSLATVLGVPLGTLMGQHISWRASFTAVGCTALGVMILLGLFLPRLPSRNAGSLSSVPAILLDGRLMRLYGITLLAVTGHFTAFTYLMPYFSEVGGFDAKNSVFLLLLLGGSGFAGSVLGSLLMKRFPRSNLFAPLCALLVCLALLQTACASLPGAIILCCAWGTAMPALGVVMQGRVLTAAPEATDVASAIYSGAFNIGIGGGALAGSQIFSTFGIWSIGYAGALFMTLAAGMTIWALRRSD